MDEELENKVIIEENVPEAASVSAEPSKNFNKEDFAKDLLTSMRVNL